MCARLEDDWDLQYLSEFKDLKGAYTEFNIDEKLQSDFSMQLESLRQSVGVPYMTPNEGRAILNLPRLKNPLADTSIFNMATLKWLCNNNRTNEMPIIETKASQPIMPEYRPGQRLGEKSTLMQNVLRQRGKVTVRRWTVLCFQIKSWDRKSLRTLKLAEETAQLMLIFLQQLAQSTSASGWNGCRKTQIAAEYIAPAPRQP